MPEVTEDSSDSDVMNTDSEENDGDIVVSTKSKLKKISKTGSIL